jgi:hypothetical protein
MTTMLAVAQFVRGCALAPVPLPFICLFLVRGWLPDKSDQKNSFAMNGLLRTVRIGL